MELYFLTLEDILEIHADQIAHYGGKGGIRDHGLLISAIMQPESMFEGEYLHQSIFDKASAYLYHICQNHPFIDGNKRVALVSMLIFLDLNGESIDFDEVDLEELTFAVARGEVEKNEVADFLQKKLIPYL